MSDKCFDSTRFNEFTAFCSRAEFKSYVREAIDDKLFWDRILNTYRVQALVDNRMNEITPQKVRQSLPIAGSNCLWQSLDQVLSGLVAKEILCQLPNIVGSDYRMQKLLEKHTDDLRYALETESRKIVTRIVTDEGYHEINRIYFQTFSDKGDKNIRDFNTRANAIIQSTKADFEQQLHNLTSALNTVDKYQRTLDDMESQITFLKFAVFGLTVSFAALCGYMTYQA